MKLFKRHAPDTPSPTASAGVGRSRPGLLLPGLAAAAAGTLAAGCLLWFTLFAPAQAVRSQGLVQAWGTTQASALGTALDGLRAEVEASAGNPALREALLSEDPQRVEALERSLIGYRDLVVDVYVSRRGRASQDRERPAPMNYAALDLLRRVEAGQQPPAEAYRVADRWIVYTVTAIRESEGGPILGTLLMAFDLQRVLRNLPPLPAGIGGVRLLQSFDRGDPQTLLQRGSGDASLAQTFATPNPHWRLEFLPGPALALRTGTELWLLLALLLALAGAGLGLLLTQRRLRHWLADDAARLDGRIQELSHGKAIKAPSLNLPELDGVARSISELSRRKTPTPPETAASPTPPATTEAPPVRGAWPSEGNRLGEEFDPLSADFLDVILEEDQDLLGLDIKEQDPAMTSVQAPKLPASIFRAYDIRGIVGDSLTAETAYWIGRAIGSESLAQGEANVSVGRDGRLSGPELVQGLIQGIADCGCSVSDIGMVPTPVLYYAANILAGKSGVMLTGSHNPPDYNGFKIVIAGDTLANEQIQRLRERIETGDLASGTGTIEQVEVLQRYFEQVRNDIAVARKLKVVVDCGNGVAGVIAPQLVEALGCEVIPLFCDVDGTFPNHHPDPGKPENLEDLIAKVRETGADLGLAFDGDGDRVGVVTNAGTIIYPDRLLMLFAKDVVSRNPGADIIYDVKCTRRLTNLIRGYGGRPVMYKTGHSLIKKKMKETGALLAGEMSGHVFFKERWYGFDDGIYSAARLLEILSQDNRDVETLFAAFPNDVSTPEINVKVTEESKFAIIDALQRNGQWGEANLVTLDGVRVDYPKGWGLVRASNTTPVLVLRFEAESAEELKRIQDVFREQLYTVAPDLQLPF